MGDHRLNVDISVVGADCKEYKVDMWLNWHEDRPEEIYRAIVAMAQKAGLPINDKTYLFDYV
jgi:hypothetical protein